MKKRFLNLLLIFAMLFNFVMPFKVHAVGVSEKAWFIWNNNGNIAAYYFDDLEGADGTGENMVFPINMIRASDIDDGGVKPNISDLVKNDNNYAWVTETGHDEIVAAGITNWNGFLEYKNNVIEHSKEIDDRDYEWDRIFDPMGGRTGNNSISTNANRRFRATIYNDSTYEAIQFGTNVNDYVYFPSDWDPTFMDSTIDISNTTEENPAVYSSFLLEKNLKFKVSDFSVADIKSVTALNVNPKAVTISLTPDMCTIKFNSNYYDAVTFKLTDSNNKDYYLKVNRYTGKMFSNTQFYGDLDDKLYFGLELFYDSETSYSDYEVKAYITYNDGSTKIIDTKVVNSWKMDNDTGEWVSKKEYNAGVKMKSAAFAFELTNNIKSVDFTVIKKNALSDIANTYGGTFAGSGKGIHFEKEVQQAIERSRRA